ncbi:MAG TPA: hypothetical protein VK607_04265, partial [Kofleriaceae bacterium]|nr:hypothetical protein [Kofleriaceae bacterium]
MRIFSHHSILAATAISLSLGLGAGSTVAQPPAQSRHGDARIRGIDLERSTIPELQDAMDHHRLSSV